MIRVRLIDVAVVALIGCSGGSQPVPADRTTSPGPEPAPIVAVASVDAAVGRIDAAVGPLIDERAPAKLAFIAKPGRSLSGHMRASWPLDLPEMPWVANTFVNLALDSYDGTSVVGTVEMYAAPGLDTRTCTIEVLWDMKRGVQLAGPPTIENVDDHVGTHATWRFRSSVPDAPPGVKATAFAFCPNDVSFYSIEMIAPGPKLRDAYCQELRVDRVRAHPGETIHGHTYELQFACGTLIRLRGRDLVDECRGDTLLSIDALGAGVTASAPAGGTPPTDEELRHWYAGASMCAEVHLAASPEFPESANKPFAAFVKRAGDRLEAAFTRDGMPQP